MERFSFSPNFIQQYDTPAQPQPLFSNELATVVVEQRIKSVVARRHCVEVWRVASHFRCRHLLGRRFRLPLHSTRSCEVSFRNSRECAKGTGVLDSKPDFINNKFVRKFSQNPSFEHELVTGASVETSVGDLTQQKIHHGEAVMNLLRLKDTLVSTLVDFRQRPIPKLSQEASLTYLSLFKLPQHATFRLSCFSAATALLSFCTENAEVAVEQEGRWRQDGDIQNKMETFKKFKLASISELQAMPDHHPDEPFYTRAVSELQEIEETINLVVSDLASFPPCVSPSCPHHESVSKTNSPKISPHVTPTKRTLNFNNNRTSNKRKEDSDFEYPPLRKTTKRQILNIPNDSISISPNKFSLPSDSNIEEVTGSQNAIPVVTSKPPSPTGSTLSGNQNTVKTLPPQLCLELLKRSEAK
ncbi:hypothetical protein TNCV_2420451 [Trichonephila clavipes]|nr:hypothetical protein TNCV_2420451 [Trichonephila clavipes]